jgi:hypothetical protein
MQSVPYAVAVPVALAFDATPRDPWSLVLRDRPDIAEVCDRDAYEELCVALSRISDFVEGVSPKDMPPRAIDKDALDRFCSVQRSQIERSMIDCLKHDDADGPTRSTNKTTNNLAEERNRNAAAALKDFQNKMMSFIAGDRVRTLWIGVHYTDNATEPKTEPFRLLRTSTGPVFVRVIRVKPETEVCTAFWTHETTHIMSVEFHYVDSKGVTKSEGCLEVKPNREGNLNLKSELGEDETHEGWLLSAPDERTGNNRVFCAIMLVADTCADVGKAFTALENKLGTASAPNCKEVHLSLQHSLDLRRPQDWLRDA